MATPSWYTPDPNAPAPAPVAANNGPPPAWYQPEAQPAAPAQSSDYGIGKNLLTGLARIPGVIASLPAVLAHTKHWADAQVENAATGGHETGADLDNANPVTRVLNKATNAVANAPFTLTGTTPYEPQTTGGKLGQAAVTGVGAGLLDPAADLSMLKSAPNFGKALVQLFKANAGNAAKTGAAAAAAEGAHEIAPDSGVLPVAAAMLTHSGAGLAADTARSGYRVVRPIVAPRAAAETAAANVLANAPHGPGVANPSSADIDKAVADTKATTDALGEGLDDYTAGGNIREDLQKRKDALLAQRSDAADTAYSAFRNEQPLEAVKLAPFMSRPSFQKAVKGASGAVIDEGGKPLTEFLDFNEAGDPVFRPNAAVPPDVLDRIKGQLDDQVSLAQPGTRDSRTKTMLRNQFVSFLDDQYPNTYPQTRADFAAASRPLDPLTSGPVSKVLDSETNFGRRSYAMPQDRIADTFLKSRAMRSDMDALVAGYGGDKQAAMSNLRENLVSKVQDAIDPTDGTLSQGAFDKAVRPYTRALGMWFPDLAKQFSTAKAAQGTLDLVRAQEKVADGIRGGALRDQSGVVTKGSFTKWLEGNAKTLAKTQDNNAVVRLRSIANALPETPGAGAEAAVEGIPAAVGFSMGGSEAGIFGAMFHKIPEALAGPQMAKFKEEYSRLIEDAVTNPSVRNNLAHRINSRPRGQTPLQAVGQAVLARLKGAAAKAPLAATSAGVFPPTQR